MAADHIDYAANFLQGTMEHHTNGAGVIVPLGKDYPWVGLVLGMFEELAARGFTMSRSG